MDLDTTGGLVEILSRQGIDYAAMSGSWQDDSHVLLEYLQLVIAPWKDFASDWVARCTTDNEGVYFVNFRQIVDVTIGLQWTGFFLASCSKYWPI